MYLDYYSNPELQLDFTTNKTTGVRTLKDRPVEVSSYQPSDAARLATQADMGAFWYARVVQQAPYAEFNDTSVIVRQTHDLRVFNAWTPAPSDDPDLSWMSDAYSPIARNKVISVAAHLTRATVFPEIVATDSDEQEDKDAAEVMNDLMEWVAEQSDYVKTFLYAVIDALVLPAAIIHHEYAKVYRKQKTIQADGTSKEEYVLDELFSGFRDTLLGDDELFIADPFIDDIQKQPYLIWRRAIEYDAAYAKYHSTKLDKEGNVIPNNFDLHVKPGIQLLFDAQTVLFYRQYDENLRGKLVEEVQVFRRAQDIHRIYVNGVLVTDPDRPNQRTDKLYPFCKGGYEPYNHRFFWYCSLIKKLSKDEEVFNTIRRMFIDGTYLSIFKPTFVMGEESIDGSVVVPGTVIPLKSDTKVVPYDIGANLKAGIDAMNELKDSIEQSAASGEAQQGQNSEGQQTAQEVATVEENARVMLGLFAKMISFLVKDWGKLIVGDILQHLTVGQADEILDGEAKLKFNKFLVHKTVNGKSKGRRIIFDPDLPKKTEKMPRNDDGKILHFDLVKDEGHKIKNGKLQLGNKEIVYVNPDAFRKLKFITKMRAEAMTPPSDIVERALNIEEYDRLIQNPRADQDEALRTLLLGSYQATKNDPDKFIAKQQPQQPQGTGTVMNPQAQQNPSNAQGTLGKIMSMSKFQRNPQAKAMAGAGI